MESELPPTAPNEATTPGAPPVESLHDRHLHEMESSFEALEQNVEHGLVRMLKIAVPAVGAVILAAVGSYMLGAFFKDRAERILGRRAGRRARRQRSPALVDGPLSPSEAGEIISGVLAEVEA